MQRNSLNREPLDIETLMQSIEEDGGLAAIMEGMRRHQEICMRLDRERATLLSKHPEKWVVMGETGVLSIGDSFKEMLSVAKGAGLDTSEFAITYLDPDPLVQIL